MKHGRPRQSPASFLLFIRHWVSCQQMGNSKQQSELQELTSKYSELDTQNAALTKDLSEAQAGLLTLRDRESALLSDNEALSNQIVELTKAPSIRTTASASSHASDVCTGVVCHWCGCLLISCE